MRQTLAIIGTLLVAILLVLGACTPTPTPEPVPEPKPTPSLTPSRTEKAVDYASLSVIAIERANEVRLKAEVVEVMGEKITQEPRFTVFGIAKTPYDLQPRKGMDALILVVRVKNPVDRYIFQNVMPGYVYDTQGQEYREEGDAVRGEPKSAKSSYTEIFVKELDWVKVIYSTDATQDIIAPGESYDWIFIFHIPKERSLTEFAFKYAVGETADPLVGELQEGYSSIPVTE
jgi:hypothetical protein